MGGLLGGSLAGPGQTGQKGSKPEVTFGPSGPRQLFGFLSGIGQKHNLRFRSERELVS